MVISLALSQAQLLVVFPRVLCWAPYYLHAVFVNEIPSIVSSPELMFADDTKIFGVITNGDDFTALQNATLLMASTLAIET